MLKGIKKWLRTRKKGKVINEENLSELSLLLDPFLAVGALEECTGKTVKGENGLAEEDVTGCKHRAEEPSRMLPLS